VNLVGVLWDFEKKNSREGRGVKTLKEPARKEDGALQARVDESRGFPGCPFLKGEKEGWEPMSGPWKGKGPSGFQRLVSGGGKRSWSLQGKEAFMGARRWGGRETVFGHFLREFLGRKESKAARKDIN